MTLASQTSWFSLKCGLLVALVSSVSLVACSGGEKPKDKSSKEDKDKDKDKEEENSTEEGEEEEEEDSSTDEEEEEEEEEEDEKDKGSSSSTGDAEEEEETGSEDESSSSDESSDDKSSDDKSTGDDEPEGDCKVTAEWGSGKPFAAGTHVPNWEMEAVFDQNGDGKIEGDERSPKKVTLADVYCATPRNKFAIITFSSLY